MVTWNIYKIWLYGSGFNGVSGGLSDTTPMSFVGRFGQGTAKKAQYVSSLDDHVCEVAHRLHLTRSKSYTLNNAKAITRALAEVFPDDPCLGDFALFGYGINDGK